MDVPVEHDDAAEQAPPPRSPATAGSPEPTQPAPPARRRHRLRTALLTVTVVLGVVVVALGWVGYRAWQTAHALKDAQALVDTVQDEVRAGDVQSLADAVPQIQALTRTARESSGDPVWRAAEVLPVLGTQLRAVRTVSSSLDDVAVGVLPAVASLGTALDGREADEERGRLVLAQLVEVAPGLVDASVTARSAADDVAAIDTDGLLGPLVDPVTRARDALEEAATALEGGAGVASLLPAMLGSDEPRTYLLLSLNSAELRSGGGIVGAVVVLQAQGGRLELRGQLSTADLPGLDEPVLPLSDAELTVDTARLGRWVQDATMTPDFPRTAELVAARWEQQTGGTVDGVIAADPVAVSYLLGATGPIGAPDGSTLDAGGVVAALLHDSYLTYPDAGDADRYYAGVASAIFGAVTAGKGDVGALGQALVRAGEEGRLRMWSAHPDEQDRILGTDFAGAFLSEQSADEVGVFLNDGTPGKLDYFLQVQVSVEDLQCDGPDPTAQVRVSLSYDPPADIATYPDYVIGAHREGRPDGWVDTNLNVYAPVGAPLGALEKDGGWVSGTSATLDGRAVQVVRSSLDPGQSESYTFAVPVRDGQVVVRTTPTVGSPGSVVASCAP
ncbi:DUF4012 domain-containing protein [Cellulomonas soli]|uniref:DUF4012 domain-containing protein n=1 Tax=Cellulomonas soli TaxID=931535 RepID=A0A512PGP4_9CELL|nr:DUF4012 domain-containing protein [Cellulomonas soli]NYI59581.1 hypothetical protein [Cellulomonas soli]GEP70371.1 hypothetical protein CSO01_30860 [Cellulomonas soli]